MTSKYVKISSLQGISTIQDKQLVDFEIPANSYYNLANSYVSLMAKLQTTESSVSNLKGVHACVASGLNNIPYKNNVLVRDYKFTSDRYPDIENVQESNKINVNMDVYGRDFEQIQSQNYQSLFSQFNDPRFMNIENKYGNFRTLNKTGASTEDVFEAKIPLNSFSSFCNTPLYDTTKFGRSQLKLQMDLSTKQLSEFNPYPSTVDTYIAQNIAAAAPHNVLVLQNMDYVLDGLSLAVGPAAFAIVNYTLAAGARVELKSITASAYTAANNGTITLTLNTAIAAGDATNITVRRYDRSAQMNTVGATVADANISYLITTFTTFTVEQITDFKQYIGRKVCIIGGDCAALVAGFNSVLTNVETVNPHHNVSAMKLTFNPPFAKTAAETANNINFHILQASSLACDNVGPAEAGGELINVLTTTAEIKLEDCKLWVGCKVSVMTAIDDGGGGTTYNKYYTTVSSLEQNGNFIDIEINDAINLAANATMTLVKIQSVGLNRPFAIDGTTGLAAYIPGSMSLELYQPSLVLHELYPTHSQVKSYMAVSNKQLQYSLWKVEAVNIPRGTTSFVRLFQVDGSVRNAFAIIPKTENLLSASDNIASYRWRINNYDKTLRDIVVNSALEQDNIIQTFNNSDIINLKSLQSLQKKYGSIADFVNIPMTTVPMDGLDKTLMLTLNYTSATLTDKVLYLVKEATVVLHL